MNPLPESLQQALMGVLHYRPYLAPLALSLTPQPIPPGERGPDFSFAITPRGVMFFDPEKNEAFTLHERMFVLYHEMLHLLLHHFPRAESLWSLYPDELINIAMDAEINYHLRGEEFCTPPQSIVTAEKLGWKEGLLFEEYLSQTPITRITVTMEDLGEEGGSSFGPRLQKREGGWVVQQGTGDVTPGSASSSPEKGTREKEGLSATRLHQLAAHIAQQISQHSNPGTIPEFLRRWASALLSPQVPWPSLLRAYLSRTCASVRGYRHQTWRRPHRRSEAIAPFLLPSYRDSLLNLCLVLDTSGSMGEAELNRQLAEVDGILKAQHYPVTVLCCDAAVKPAQRVLSAHQLALTGGGGTEMTEGIRAAQELRPRPDVLIILTDGYTSWTDTHPGIPTILLLIHSNQEPPGWANAVVRVQENSS